MAQDRAARLGKRLRWAGYALVALVVPVLLATRGSHLPGEVFVVQGASLAIAVAGLWLRRRYPEHTHWDEPSDKTRPSVMEPLLLAGLAPLTVAIFRDLIEARLLVMGALTIGLAAWALVLWRMPEVRQRSTRSARVLASLLFCCVGWGAGAVVALNDLGDGAPEQVYATTVVEKLKPSSRQAHRLVLAPWALDPSPDHLRVSSDVYQATKPGDRIGLLVRRGRLGLHEIRGLAAPPP